MEFDGVDSSTIESLFEIHLKTYQRSGGRPRPSRSFTQLKDGEDDHDELITNQPTASQL